MGCVCTADVGVGLGACPLPGCILTAVPRASGETMQWRPSTPTKQRTMPSYAGQVSTATPFQSWGGLVSSLQ